MPEIIAAVERQLETVSFRAVVAGWNKRAQRAAEHAGFKAVGEHENDRGTYVVFARQAR